MRYVFMLFILFMGFACEQAQPNRSLHKASDEDETPEVFNQKNTASKLRSYSYSSQNVVAEMFEEYLDEHPDLRQEITRFREQNNQIAKHKDPITDFHANNLAYYQSAKMLAGELTDSILAQKIIDKIELSHKQYDQIQFHTDTLVTSIQQHQNDIQDLILLLKIYKTLPMIEAYQNASQPPINQLKDDLKRLKELQQSLEKEL